MHENASRPVASRLCVRACASACVCVCAPRVCFSVHAHLCGWMWICVSASLSRGGCSCVNVVVRLGLWGTCSCMCADVCGSLWAPVPPSARVCACMCVGGRGREQWATLCAGLVSWHPIPQAGQLPLEAQGTPSHVLSAVRLSTGMLLDVQNFFQISDSNAGLLQTGKD